MSLSKFWSVLCIIIFSSASQAQVTKGKYFDRAMYVIFENTNYSAAMKKPFFKKLAGNGANFTNFTALKHPSQGNYIALTSGSLNGVKNDSTVNINSTNIVDLLEAKGVTWKVYAEGYPGNCFTGSQGRYVRKHNPFISYLNIQKDPARCANIVNAIQFDEDLKNNTLPQYMFYIPDLNNDAHDTGIDFADKWYSKKMLPLLKDENFTKNTILITTFDESGISLKNQIYTSIVGPMVAPGSYSKALTLYSLLNLMEDNWGLGDLGRADKTAPTIPAIWK